MYLYTLDAWALSQPAVTIVLVNKEFQAARKAGLCGCGLKIRRVMQAMQRVR
jgi:hypothetical protein